MSLCRDCDWPQAERRCRRTKSREQGMTDYTCRLHRDQREHDIGVFAQLPHEAEFQRGGKAASSNSSTSSRSLAASGRMRKSVIMLRSFVRLLHLDEEPGGFLAGLMPLSTYDTKVRYPPIITCIQGSRWLLSSLLTQPPQAIPGQNDAAYNPATTWSTTSRTAD